MSRVNYSTGQDVGNQGGGNYLKERGNYHFVITGVDCPPTKKDGSLVDNGFFRLNLSVAAASVPDQENKQSELTFFHPKPTGKNAGAFARKKIDRCLIATNVLQVEQLGQPLDFDTDAMIGQQFMVKLDKEKDDDYLELSFADIYHIDDPEVAKWPKNEKFLAMIPAQFRWTGDRAKAISAAMNGAKAPSAPLDPADVDL